VVDLARHDRGQIVDRKPDTVVVTRSCGKLLRPDLLAAVSRTDLPTTLRAELRLLALELDFIEARAQDPHRGLLVLKL